MKDARPRGYQLTVYGSAEPAGSKRAFYKAGLGVRVVDANPKARQWKIAVAQEAGKVAGRMLDGPLALDVTFYRPRPASHYGTGKNRAILRPSAPSHPCTRPDTTKLLRGVEDALCGVLYRDDAQICMQTASKEWGEPARVVITVKEIRDAGSAATGLRIKREAADHAAPPAANT